MTPATALPTPFHFGPQSLFGMYHHASTQPLRGAVLLCPPLGVDQIRTHRLYRQLAIALVAAGLAVLRFDYYGSGDSPGSSMELDWEQCLADTACAADELRRRSTHPRVTAFGARLGGSVALCAADSARLAHVVVWDAVRDGHAFVRAMDALHEQMRVDPARYRHPHPAADGAGQWLGFAVSDRLRRQLHDLRIRSVPVPVDWLHSASAAGDGTGAQQPPRTASATELSASMSWDDLDELETMVLVPELVNTASACLQGNA